MAERWSDFELHLLQEQYRDKGPYVLEGQLRRSWRSIVCKAWEIGLARGGDPFLETFTEAGCEVLMERIRAYWADAGILVPITIVQTRLFNVPAFLPRLPPISCVPPNAPRAVARTRSIVRADWPPGSNARLQAAGARRRVAFFEGRLIQGALP